MSGNLPDGCTQGAIDRAIEESEDPTPDIDPDDMAKPEDVCPDCAKWTDECDCDPSHPETPRDCFEWLDRADWLARYDAAVQAGDAAALPPG